MSEIEASIADLKTLVLDCTATVKEVASDNNSIKGQLLQLQQFVGISSNQVGDNSSNIPPLENDSSPPVTIQQSSNDGSSPGTVDQQHTQQSTGATAQVSQSTTSDTQTYQLKFSQAPQGSAKLTAVPFSQPGATKQAPPGHLSANPATVYVQPTPGVHPSAYYMVPGQAQYQPYVTGPQTYTTAPVGQAGIDAPRSYELQTAYRAISDKWKNVKLEPQEVFNGTNTNIKKEDIPVNAVLTTSARIVETGLRIINTQYSEDKGLAPEAANELYIVCSHLMRTLQDKQCSLVVTKTYDPDFAKQYQAVMSGNSNMRQENIEAINMTNSVMQYRIPPARSSHQQSFGGNKKSQGKKNTYYKKGGKNRDDDRSSKDDTKHDD